MTQYRFLPVEETLTTAELGCYRTYGIRTVEQDGADERQVGFLSDVSCDQAFVSLLAEWCTDGQLAPCHLMDVVLDLLP